MDRKNQNREKIQLQPETEDLKASFFINEATEVGEALVIPVKKAKEYWERLGPGLTTGASDDDPSGIGTYSEVGAKYGFQYIWLAPITFPLMAIVQEMCARIGIVTGKGLAANIRKKYSKRAIVIVSIILLITNSFNIGADLGVMGKATQLLFPGINFFVLIIFFALMSLLFQVFTTYERYAKYLKWLTLTLLSYIFSALFIELDWRQLFHEMFSFQVSFSKESIIILTAVLGTTISPYLFFWQTSQEVEEEPHKGKIVDVSAYNEHVENRVKKMRTDVWTGMMFSNIVMFFIIATAAATLHRHGITINGAAEAAEALRPLAGEKAYLLFTVGIISTGLLAIPILAGSASYALTECFRWKEGLNLKLHQGRAFYGVIALSMLLGLGMNFLGMDVIKSLIYAAVLNGIVAPIVLFYIISISSDKKIMKQWASTRVKKLLGWFVTGLMLLSSLAALAVWVFGKS